MPIIVLKFIPPFKCFFVLLVNKKLAVFFRLHTMSAANGLSFICHPSNRNKSTERRKFSYCDSLLTFGYSFLVRVSACVRGREREREQKSHNG